MRIGKWFGSGSDECPSREICVSSLQSSGSRCGKTELEPLARNPNVNSDKTTFIGPIVARKPFCWGTNSDVIWGDLCFLLKLFCLLVLVPWLVGPVGGGWAVNLGVLCKK